jgi:hypothetical protein
MFRDKIEKMTGLEQKRKSIVKRGEQQVVVKAKKL